MNCTSQAPVPASVTSIFERRSLGGFQVAIARAIEALQTILTELSKEAPSTGEEIMVLETRLHREIAQRCLDPFFGHVIQVCLDSAAVRQKAEVVLEQQVPFARLQCSKQVVRLTFLGGSTVEVTVPYILNRPPRGPGRPRRRGNRGKAGNGLYPTLDVLGLSFRVTPALAEEVARLTTLEPLDEAVQCLKQRGVCLDRKVVERISNQVAERGLAYRDFQSVEVAAGFCGVAAVGKRLVISVDGGRVRTRVEKKKGRKKRNGRRGYRGEWREPKAFTIYEIDEQGRKKREGLIEYDATMGNADAIFHRLAVSLRRIGAHLASEWVFVADGADWIWDRVPQLIAVVGYTQGQVTEVLDYYHAIEHLHGLVEEFSGWSEDRRKKWFKHLKKLLKQGCFDTFIREVRSHCLGRRARRIAKKLEYFVKHQDRTAYATFKQGRIPLGSGAMESLIRRLVNLRFKGNGIFWKAEIVEGRMHLRAQLLSRKWSLYIPKILGPRAFWGTEQPVEYTLQEAA